MMSNMVEPIQQRIDEYFSKHRKALTAKGGDMRVRQHKDGGSELEIIYIYSKGSTNFELDLWVNPDWSALFEARSRMKKSFGKVLYSLGLNLAEASDICGDRTIALVNIENTVIDVYDAFKKSVSALIGKMAKEDSEKRLGQAWARFIVA